MMIAYTDGSCFPNPGKGSWAYCLIKDDQLITDCSGIEEKITTNNRMEYLALIKVVEDHGPILTEIITDSMLLVNTCMSWRHTWKKKNWKLKKNSLSPKNIDLVLRIDELLDKYKIKVSWVKGHSGNEWNDYVDELANELVGI